MEMKDASACKLRKDEKRGKGMYLKEKELIAFQELLGVVAHIIYMKLIPDGLYTKYKT